MPQNQASSDQLIELTKTAQFIATYATCRTTRKTELLIIFKIAGKYKHFQLAIEVYYRWFWYKLFFILNVVHEHLNLRIFIDRCLQSHIFCGFVVCYIRAWAMWLLLERKLIWRLVSQLFTSAMEPLLNTK